MAVVVVGINPKRPVFHALSSLVQTTDGKKRVLANIVEDRAIQEATILYRPYRFELYCVTNEVTDTASTVARALADLSAISFSEVLASCYYAENTDALDHLVSLIADSCAELESKPFAIISDAGEFTSYNTYEDPGFFAALQKAAQGVQRKQAGESTLGYLFEAAGSFNQQLLQETQTPSASSINFVIQTLVQRMFDNIPRRATLFLGGSHHAQSAAMALMEIGASRFAVIGTSQESHNLSTLLQARLCAENVLNLELAKADMVIVAETALAPRLDKKIFKQIRKDRRDRLLLVLDLTPEGSVDNKITNLDGVYLYRAQDLLMMAASLPGAPNNAASVETQIAAKVVDLATELGISL